MTHTFTSRQYAGEHDLPQMQRLLMDARSRTDDWRYPHVGDLMWAFLMVLSHLEPREHVRLWHDAHGKLVGFALLGEDPSFECQVLPEYAWEGIESDALVWAESRLSELTEGDARRWGGRLVAGARQDDAARIAFLEDNGFVRGEYVEVNMLRSLHDPISDARPPTGCKVRRVADAGEAAARTEVENAVWQPLGVSAITGDDYARLMQLPGYLRELDVIAVAPEGIIAAYTNGWIDTVNHIGDFGPVGAREAYRRRGFTRAVLLELLRRMRALGMDRVCVSTGEHNLPAKQLYESVGFVVVNRYVQFVKPA